MNDLLNKYYDGETTLEEEQQLRESGADELLAALSREREAQVEVPAGLEQSLSESIDRWERHEEAKRRSRRWFIAASIAASVAALIAVFLSFNYPTVIVIVEPAIVAGNTTATPFAAAQEKNMPQVAETPLLAKQEKPAASKPERRSMHRHPASRRQAQPAAVQAKAATAETLSPEEEAAAIRALELFAATVSKGRDALDNTSSSIAAVQNTVNQCFEID